MSLRLAARNARVLKAVAAARPAVTAATQAARAIHSTKASQGERPDTPPLSTNPHKWDPASSSPFTEPTSPNPTVTKYAETTAQLHNYGSYLLQCLPKFVQQFSVLKDELTLHIAPTGVVPVLTFLRDHAQCQFKSCQDVSGVDYPERENRFEVVYHLLSYKTGGRIRVKTYASETSAVPSAVQVYRGADWHVYLSP